MTNSAKATEQDGEHVLTSTQRRRTPAARTPEQWAALIAGLPYSAPVKAAVASVVWWDYFGNRRVSERWAHLDELRSHYRRDGYIDTAAFRSGLLQVGYTARQVAFLDGQRAKLHAMAEGRG